MDPTTPKRILAKGGDFDEGKNMVYEAVPQSRYSSIPASYLAPGLVDETATPIKTRRRGRRSKLRRRDEGWTKARGAWTNLVQGCPNPKAGDLKII